MMATLTAQYGSLWPQSRIATRDGWEVGRIAKSLAVPLSDFCIANLVDSHLVEAPVAKMSMHSIDVERCGRAITSYLLIQAEYAGSKISLSVLFRLRKLFDLETM
jgi:hypothetical protein